MQRLNRTKPASSFLVQLRTMLASVALGSLLPTGCGGTAGPPPAVPEKPLHGTTLKMSCPSARLRSLLEPMTRVWSSQTGAKVEVQSDPMIANDGGDIGIIPFAELGTWADRGDLLPIPASLRETGHPFQWSAIHSVYRSEPYAGWGGQTFGLPLAAEGSLILYRADRFADPQSNEAFRKRFNRSLAAPASWEEFADTATFFAERDRRPSLPRFADDPDRLEELFYRVSANYDRLARTGDAAENSESLSFQFRLDTGKPRLDGAGFATAARWLASLKEHGCIPPEGSTDPVAALNEDRAVLAVLTMDDLARLQRDGRMPARYSVAALPGTRSVADPATGSMVATPGNFMPYFAGGWLGVVRRGCKNPDAAFALLAELGGPVRSQEIVAAGGFGPLRDTHLEADRLPIWLGYGFDEPRSRALQEALRSNLGKSVRNPAYGLRIPDHAKWDAALRTELKAIANGEVKPDEGMKRVVAAWDRANAAIPPERLKDWLRRAAGLN